MKQIKRFLILLLVLCCTISITSMQSFVLAQEDVSSEPPSTTPTQVDTLETLPSTSVIPEGSATEQGESSAAGSSAVTDFPSITVAESSQEETAVSSEENSSIPLPTLPQFPFLPATASNWMPDAQLRQRVASALGILETDLTQLQILGLTTLTINSSTDIDLTGLEFATNLTRLTINTDKTVTSFDLGSFPNLKDLSLYNLSLPSLPLSAAPNLENVQLNYVRIGQLEATGLSRLRTLSILEGKGISELSLTNLPLLSSLSLALPDVSTLTLQTLPELFYFSLSNNNLTALSLQALPKLKYAYLNGNTPLATLRLEQLPALIDLSCQLTNLKELTMNDLPALQSLEISSSRLQNLDLHSFPLINNIELYGNHLLHQLSVKDLSELVSLSADYNSSLARISLTNLPKLSTLSLIRNALTTLTLADFPLLTRINASENQITAIRVTNLPLLTTLNLSANKITDLRQLQRSTLSAGLTLHVNNQRLDTLDKGAINQVTTLPTLYDETGMLIPWVYPGTSGSDYSLISPNRITWLTGGFKEMTASFNQGQITYSARITQTVLNPDSEGWTLLDGFSGQADNLISNTFTRGNYSYRIDSGATAADSSGVAVTLNENHRITHLATGAVYTYTYADGNGSFANVRSLQSGTSFFNLIHQAKSKIYIRIKADGSEEMKRVDENTHQGFKIETVTWVTTSGEIRHQVTATNISGAPMTDVELLLHIDTELNLNDDINIYATGGGGIYMKGGGLTLYGEPLTGTDVVYGGRYNTTALSDFQNENNVKSAWEKAPDELLAFNVDSAMYFGPAPVALLGTGESISFSYQERVFIEGEPLPKAANNVQVNYINETGMILAEEVLQGSPGDSYTTSIKPFSNYYLLRTEGPLSGRYTFEPLVVNYIYRLKDGAPITVRYLDQVGKALTEDMKITGQITTAFATTRKAFSGYKLHSVVGDERGFFTNTEQKIIYYYQREDIPLGGAVTVQYLNQDGNPLIDDILIPGGTIGSTFSTEQKSFSGYEFVRVDGNSQGQFTGEEQKIIYHYKVEAKVKGKTKDKDKIIAQTGEKDKVILWGLGSSLWAVVLLAIRARLRFKKKGQT